MVMNKKGFLKILEAIIAIVIVLGFVVSIMPSKIKETSSIPPDLDQTTSSILKEVQNNPDFRNCVILNDAKCVHDRINGLSFPIAAHPWDYAVKTCKINSTASITDCNYDPPVLGKDWLEKDRNFINNILPREKDIYTKDTTLTVEDVSGLDTGKSQSGNYTILTIYAWSKS